MNKQDKEYKDSFNNRIEIGDVIVHRRMNRAIITSFTDRGVPRINTLRFDNTVVKSSRDVSYPFHKVISVNSIVRM